MLVTHLVSTYPCDFVTSLFTSVDYKTVTFSVFCLSLVFLLMRRTRKYLRKEMSTRGLKFIVFVQRTYLLKHREKEKQARKLRDRQEKRSRVGKRRKYWAMLGQTGSQGSTGLRSLAIPVCREHRRRRLRKRKKVRQSHAADWTGVFRRIIHDNGDFFSFSFFCFLFFLFRFHFFFWNGLLTLRNLRYVAMRLWHHRRGKGNACHSVSMKTSCLQKRSNFALADDIIGIDFLYFFLHRCLLRLSHLLTQNNKHHGSAERPHQICRHMFTTSWLRRLANAVDSFSSSLLDMQDRAGAHETCTLVEEVWKPGENSHCLVESHTFLFFHEEKLDVSLSLCQEKGVFFPRSWLHSTRLVTAGSEMVHHLLHFVSSTPRTVSAFLHGNADQRHATESSVTGSGHPIHRQNKCTLYSRAATNVRRFE